MSGGDVYLVILTDLNITVTSISMIFNKYKPLSDDSLVRLYEMDIDVRYVKEIVWGQMYQSYDKEAIMRRHAINTIIND